MTGRGFREDEANDVCDDSNGVDRDDGSSLCDREEPLLWLGDEEVSW